MDLLTEFFTWATGLIDSLAELVTDSPLTYLLIFAMTALDVLAPVIPAEATVTAAAVLAGQGSLNILWVMVAAGLGAFVGDNIAYWIGRAAGRPLVERVLRGNTRQLEAVQEQFHRRGGVFIVIGRFVPGGRTAVAIGAGVLHFRWLRFVVYDAAAAVIWAFQAALPGFIGGVLIQDQPWLAMVFGFGLSVLLAGGIALIQRRRDGERARKLRLKPAVVGIGGVTAALPVPEHEAVDTLSGEAERDSAHVSGEGPGSEPSGPTSQER
jgi:membrane-associated protein